MEANVSVTGITRETIICLREEHDWLIVGWLVVWLFGCLVVWLFGCLVVWLVERSSMVQVHVPV